ncbi:hypothetical protein B7463_g5509, partial [Scytalidium lignicola]
MADYYRKIELQSPEDLQYLISNVRRAANEKIDRDLPPVEGEDPMRRRVEELVQNYIRKVFETAAENITINGLPPSPGLITSSLNDSNTKPVIIEEHEPLNSKLFERAKELARQEEDLIEEIAELRKKMPGIAVEQARNTHKIWLEADEAALKIGEDRIKTSDSFRQVDLKVKEFERQKDLEESWAKGIKGLGKLKRTMPETVAKKEKAERAENYVLASDKS